MPTKAYYFRPVETKIVEQNYSEVPLYRVETKVNFYSDEAMSKLSHQKDLVFENVPYNDGWAGIL